MLKWEQLTRNSKDLVLLNPEDLDLGKVEELIEQINENYLLYKNEISSQMIEGLNNFFSECKKIKNKNVKIILRYDIYSKMLRWIVTRNNPRYTQLKFENFREAMRTLWRILFGDCFHEFRYPGRNKSYIDDNEEWLNWFLCIGGKLKN